MDKQQTWSRIQAQRKALAADLAPLSEAQWSTTTLCSEWSVRDVVAHLTASATMNGPTFFAKFAAAGFSLPRLQAKDIARLRGSSPAQTLTSFEASVGSTTKLPGPLDTMLGEVVIHAQDIRAALGIAHDTDIEAVVQVADFYKGSNLIIGAKKRISGLSLRATDTSWSHGTGPEVSGPMLPLLMAMTGRLAPLDELTGDGVSILRSRA